MRWRRGIQLKSLKNLILVLAVIALLLGAVFFVRSFFMVTEVTVTGSSHYTDQEVQDMIMTGPMGNNSLYLLFRYRNRPVTNIPFIERMDVNINSSHSITIEVYEKAVAGYVGFLDHYMYFDRDGIIVESSARQLEGIPYVTGLDFDHCVVGEQLPVKDPEIFNDILSITQLLTKYDIVTDSIYFSRDDTITLFFGEARVALGTMDNIDEKMIRLRYIVPSLKGLKGVLRMENYSEENSDGYITFEEDE